VSQVAPVNQVKLLTSNYSWNNLSSTEDQKVQMVLPVHVVRPVVMVLEVPAVHAVHQVATVLQVKMEPLVHQVKALGVHAVIQVHQVTLCGQPLLNKLALHQPFQATKVFEVLLVLLVDQVTLVFQVSVVNLVTQVNQVP
jgi:hypothetical protein